MTRLEVLHDNPAMRLYTVRSRIEPLPAATCALSLLPMRIGLSVITQANQNIWSNGLTQNVIFFAQLLRKIPFVTELVFLNCGDQDCLPPGVDLAELGAQLVPVAEGGHLVDVIFEIAGALDVTWLDQMRSQGKKVIAYTAGQPYIHYVEAPMFGRDVYMPRPDRMDEVWLLPKDMAMFAPMMRMVHRCPVLQAPYLWSPYFLEKRIKEVEPLGFSFGFKPRQIQADGHRRGLRVTMLEPNISVVKSSAIPLALCEAAYRTQPQAVDNMVALNTLHLVERPALLHLAHGMNLVKDSRATFLGRHDFVGHMVQHSDAVVSHQWQNDQNYGYMDALYGGYPLVHNSPWIQDLGYFYPGFDVQAGAAQLLYAHQHHEEQAGLYREKTQALVQSLSSYHDANIDAYAQLLQRLLPATAAALKVAP
jgi:hypothetical protein